MDRRIPPGISGRVPLAVIVVDAAGLVSHWSTGARRLFGPPREEAVGRPAVDLLPLTGALETGRTARPGAVTRTAYSADSPYARYSGYSGYGGYAGYSGAYPADGELGPELEVSLSRGSPYPTAGWARLHDMPRSGPAPLDVLWWAYPLAGPGPERLLVLAADGSRVRPGGPAAGADTYAGADTHAGADTDAYAGADPYAGPTALDQVAPGFALHTEFAGSGELARRLPEILPSMNPLDSARIAAQVLELGYPVLEISRHDRVPVTPDWGVPRREDRGVRQAGRRAAPAADPAGPSPDPAAPGLEYAADRERLEFLNEVSGRIGTSLDLARTIREVSRAVVPRFTDLAGTYLREQVLAGEGFPDGPPDVTTMWYRVAVEHTDEPGRWDDVVPVGESMPFPEHTPFFRCMTTGEPVLVPRIGEEMGHAIAAQFPKRDISPLITHRSMLVVPLKAREVVLGFMILLRHRDRPAFNGMDRVTGAELAARAGLVLDNARMYTYQENVAETLQDSMLPHIAPRMPGCDVATRYLPGTRLGRVGGDWFDTIKLSGSRLALVVGDVMGHGLNSAAMMGQFRTAVQAVAGLGTPPDELLRNLDDLARRLGEQYLATCLYVVYDPVASDLLIANAGHVPPVLVRAADGRSELLDVPTGAPLGVGGVAFETVRVPVAPGDRLVLCTDGLVEVRGQDIGTGLAALCESAAHPAASMDDACDTIIRALNPRGGRKDDVALLMARLSGIPGQDVASWELDLDPREAARARGLVRETLRRWDLAEISDTAELLVGEVVTNAVRHAHTRRIGLRLVRAGALLCEVSDDDHAMPVLRGSGPDDEGGRGLRIVSRLAAEWGASRSAGGKTVWFEQKPPGRSPAGRR